MSIRDRDLKFSEDGDLVIEDGDFQVASSPRTVKQEILNRIQTNNPDWFRHLNGADLEDLVGEDNTRELAERGARQIERCLTHDGYLSSSDFNIDYVPTGPREITFYIRVNTPYEDELVIDYRLNLG